MSVAHDQQTGQQRQSHAGAEGPSHAGQVGGEGRITQVPELDPVAGKKPEVEQPEDRRRDVSDGAGHRLEQQPAADHGAGGRQDRTGDIRGQATASGGRLGGEQQQLHRDEGRFGGGTDPP